MIAFFQTKFGKFVLILVLLFTIFGSGVIFNRLSLSRKNIDVLQAPFEVSPIQLEAGQQYVTRDFQSHLPLVIIDTGEDRPGHGTIWDEEKGYPVAVDYDPFAYGTIQIIANEDGLNHVSDEAALDSYVKLRIRGTSSAGYPKKQYLVKLIDENGKSKNQNVFNMGKDNDWILNISWQDPSLMRNYLAYTIAKQTKLLSPDVQYVEVIYKDGDVYEYLGVYLWMEKVNRSPFRVDIPPYKPNQSFSFIMRRDRYDEDGTILSTYASQNGYIDEYIEVLYPSADEISGDDIKRMESLLDEFEKKLYSKDNDIFLQYRDYININTFVDYFIFNEFFMNYDAGRFSTYIYQDYTGRMSIGPVWDFDRALANDPLHIGEMTTTAMQSLPWFDQLLRDPSFVHEVIERYRELRQTALSKESLMAFVDGALAYLQTAAQRDWNRWQYELNINERATFPLPVSITQETAYIKEVFITHGNWLDLNIDSLYQFSDVDIDQVKLNIAYEEKANDYSEFLAIIFVAAVLVSALFLQRES